MSGVVKGVKKAFKKVVKVIKKIWKPVVIAVAAYFTAGVALSYIPATSAFAASMPGFAAGGALGTGIGAGSVAGAGVFSQAATAIGLGGGLAAGATIANTGAAAAAIAGGMGVAEAASIYGAGAVEAAMTGTIAGSVGAATGVGASAAVGASGLTGAAATGATQVAGTVAAAGGGAAGGAALAAKAGMSLTDKLLLAKTGTDLAGSLFGPDPRDVANAEAEAAAKFRGAFYGMDAQGNTGEPPPAGGASGLQMPQVGDPGVRGQPVQSTPAQQAGVQMPTGSLFPEDDTSGQTGQLAPTPQQAMNAPPQPQQLFGQPGGAQQQHAEEQPADEANPMLFGQGQMKQQINVPGGIFAPTPGVRYV